jgi:hypothetical protein
MVDYLKPSQSSTESIFVQGKAKWAMLHRPNEWGNWKITLYPDTASLEKIKNLQGQGLKNVLKKDEDGYHMSFNRPHQKMIKGKVIGFTPPEVLESDGKTPLTTARIGNGSDVTVKLEVYAHSTPGGGRAKAARLGSIRVDNLVPFVPERDFNDVAKEQIAGLADQPAPIF